MKKAFKMIGYTILTLVLLVGLYLLSAYTFSRISVEKEANQPQEITIYILSNGVHTDLVMPIRNDQVDWSKQVKFEDTKGKDSTMSYVGVGWGDKGFYLETPTWADLTFRVAFKAAFHLGTSAIHATFHKELVEGEKCKKILISKTQYARLIDYVKHSFLTDAQGAVINIKTNSNYGDNDAFYEATRVYSLFHTCNTWANNGLKSCGQRAALWTPFDTGIFYHYADKEK